MIRFDLILRLRGGARIFNSGKGFLELLGGNERFQQLANFKQAHGGCKKRHQDSYSGNPQLGFWLMAQLGMKRKATLGDEHKAQLDSIGFIWGK
jgi:hypothetical protein